MHPLYQRLKELDPQRFEQLCFHLLKERHPNQDIRHVDGAAGDDGIDIFAGDFDGRPWVWQCKSFVNGIRDSQKQQIRDSFNTALEKLRPSTWILCISIDMDTPTFRWFRKYQESKKGLVDVGLWQGSDIVHELIHRKTICNEFFPQAVIDTMALREALAKTGELTDNELAGISAENVEQYIERLRQHDSRFNYEIVFSPDAPLPARKPRAGLIASFSDDKKTINVLARDHKALLLDPPRAKITVTPTGAQKLAELDRTGRPQLLKSGEVISYDSDFRFLVPSANHPDAGLTLSVSKELESVSPLHTRVTFGVGSNAVVFDYVEFRFDRLGTEELELISIGAHPLELRLAFVRGEIGRAQFTYFLKGSKYRELKKVVNAFDALASDCLFEVYDLRQGVRLFRGQVSSFDADLFEVPLRRLIDDAVAVSQHYGVDLAHPEDPLPDLDTLAWLRSLMDGYPRQIRDMALNLTKTADNSINPLSMPAIRIVEPSRRLTVFGVEVDTGNIVLTIKETSLDSNQCSAYNAAAEGDTVELTLNAELPAEVRAAGVVGVQ